MEIRGIVTIEESSIEELVKKVLTYQPAEVSDEVIDAKLAKAVESMPEKITDSYEIFLGSTSGQNILKSVVSDELENLDWDRLFKDNIEDLTEEMLGEAVEGVLEKEISNTNWSDIFKENCESDVEEAAESYLDDHLTEMVEDRMSEIVMKHEWFKKEVVKMVTPIVSEYLKANLETIIKAEASKMVESMFQLFLHTLNPPKVEVQEEGQK